MSYFRLTSVIRGDVYKFSKRQPTVSHPAFFHPILHPEQAPKG